MHYQSTPYRSKIVQTQRIQFNLVSLSSHVYINITSTQSMENFQKFGSESREEGAEGQTYPHESRKTWIRFQEARLFSPLPLPPSFAVSLAVAARRWGAARKRGTRGELAAAIAAFFFIYPLGGADIDRRPIGGTKERKTKEADKKTRGRWWMGGARTSWSRWMVTGAAAGGHSPEIDEHDKSSGGDTGLSDSTRQPTDLRIQCIEFLSSRGGWRREREGTPCKYLLLSPSHSLFQNSLRFVNCIREIVGGFERSFLKEYL